VHVDPTLDSTSQLKYDNNIRNHTMSQLNLPLGRGDDVESPRNSYEDVPARVNADIPLERRTTLPPAYEPPDSASLPTMSTPGPSDASSLDSNAPTSEVQQKHVHSTYQKQVSAEGESSYGDA
jgi:hypothetical protein